MKYDGFQSMHLHAQVELQLLCYECHFFSFFCYNHFTMIIQIDYSRNEFTEVISLKILEKIRKTEKICVLILCESPEK